MEDRHIGIADSATTAPSAGGIILGMRVDGISAAGAITRIIERAATAGGGYVCVANVHMIMEAFDCTSFRAGVNRALAVVPDGMPLVWCLRQLGHGGQERVAGPDLLPRLCDAAARRGLSVGFYGGTPIALQQCAANLVDQYPGLDVALTIAPPFRPLTPAETSAMVERINASGADILFVALGCPKQERWMMENADRLRPVLVGMGAAIDYHAGMLARAPGWMQGLGLEWLFRLAVEPRRLARRYAIQNPRFVWHVLMAFSRRRWHEVVGRPVPAERPGVLSRSYVTR